MMITLKSPMVLNSISFMGIHSDMLGEKIVGNYSMIGTSITSEDFVHMTVQPPDVFVRVDNYGSIINDNRFDVDNSAKLEIVNQLVNRIMLYGTTSFTYQDEVYISSILQKMGITNLEEFMNNIKVDMERNTILTNLVNKYFEINNSNFKLVDMKTENVENNNGLPVDITNRYETDLYIQNDIFKRLNTAQYNNTVYDYNNLYNMGNKSPSVTDLTFLEQADQIQLTQLREKLLSQASPSVWNEYLRYEVKSLELGELTKENITKRISMAVLENLIEKVSYVSQSFYEHSEWTDYIPVLYKSSLDVIERFKYYQTSFGNINMTQINDYNYYMGRLNKDESRLADMVMLTDNYEDNQVNEEYINQTRRNIIVSMLENQNIQKQVSERLAYQIKEKTNDIISKNIYDNDRLMLAEMFNDSRNYYASIVHNENSDIVIYNSRNNTSSEIYDVQKQLDISDTIQENINEIIGDNDYKIGNVTDFQDNYITQLINKYSGTEYGDNISFAENLKFLEELNNHNLYMKETLEATPVTSSAQQKNIVVDRKKAMKDALKAIENPEEVRLEVLVNGKAIEKELPGEIERILSITDDNTREFYEKIVSDVYNINNYNTKKKAVNINDEPIVKDTLLVKDVSEKSLIHEKEIAKENSPLQIIDNIIDTANTTMQSFYSEVLASKDIDGTSLYMVDDTMYREGDTINERRDSNIYNVSNIIKNSGHENDIAYTNEHIRKVIRDNELVEQFVHNEGEIILNSTSEININTNNETLRSINERDIQNLNIQREVINGRINEVLNEKKATLSDNVVNKISTQREHQLTLVHAVHDDIHDELVEEITQNIQRGKNINITVKDGENQNQVTLNELQNMKRELISQSEENITRIVNQNIQTQVHTISDMVYVELEKRLRNEQRRRGY